MSMRIKTYSLLVTVMFSLSWLPGLSGEVHSDQSLELSSNAAYDGDCNFNDWEVRRAGKDCRALLRSDSNTKASIKAQVVKVKKVRGINDPELPEGEDSEEMLKIDMTIEGAVNVPGCSTCSTRSVPARFHPISQAKNVAAIALREFEQEAERLRAEAAREAAEAKKRDACLVDASNRTLEGRAKRDCLLAKIAGMEPEAAARYYNENMKDMLQDMLTSDNPQVRKDAMDMLKVLQQTVGNNPYLKESIKDMAAFGKFHRDMTDLLLRREMIRDPRQRAAVDQQLESYYRFGKSYFGDRGLKVGPELDRQMGGEFGSMYGANLSEFQTQLEDIYNTHRNNISGGSQLPGTNGEFQTRQGQNPNAGRGTFVNRNGQMTLQPSMPYVPGAGTVGRPGTNMAPRPGAPAAAGAVRAYGAKVK